MGKKIKITFNISTPFGHKNATESLWAEKINENDYKLINIPFFVYDISLNDILRANLENGILFFNKVVSHSGHSTYRLLLNKNAEKRIQKYIKPISNLGCIYESMDYGSTKIFAVDVPPKANIHNVYKLLEEGENAGIWTFEEGHCGHQIK